MTAVRNERAEAARSRARFLKARKMADVCRNEEMTSAVVGELSDHQWALIARIAGVHPASLATRWMVADILDVMEEVHAIWTQEVQGVFYGESIP